MTCVLVPCTRCAPWGTRFPLSKRPSSALVSLPDQVEEEVPDVAEARCCELGVKAVELPGGWSICTALHCVAKSPHVSRGYRRMRPGGGGKRPDRASWRWRALSSPVVAQHRLWQLEQQAVPVNDECTGGVRVEVMEDVVRMAPRTYSWRSKGYVRTRNGGGGGRRVSVWYVLLLVDEFTE